VLFGVNGFVIGPLIAALFVAVWEIFTREFYAPEEDRPHADPVPGGGAAPADE
jgi:predicted PurR-regulated permease PerM